jgi:chromosome partitioning protein
MAIPGTKPMKFEISYLENWIKSRMTFKGDCKVITFGNQKGGVGKTSCCFNISFELARLGYKVLLIDMDPQGTLSMAFDLYGRREGTLYTLIESFYEKKENFIRSHILPTNTAPGGNDNLFLITGDERMGSMYETLNRKPGSRTVLRKLLAPLMTEYDFVLIDTAPSRLDSSISAALNASNYILTPVIADKHSYDALASFMELVEDLKVDDNPELQELGLIVTSYKKSVAQDHIIEELRPKYEMLHTYLSYSVTAFESQLVKLPLSLYDGGINLAMSYLELVKEILAKLNMQEKNK